MSERTAIEFAIVMLDNDAGISEQQFKFLTMYLNNELHEDVVGNILNLVDATDGRYYVAPGALNYLLDN